MGSGMCRGMGAQGMRISLDRDGEGMPRQLRWGGFENGRFTISWGALLDDSRRGAVIADLKHSDGVYGYDDIGTGTKAPIRVSAV